VNAVGLRLRAQHAPGGFIYEFVDDEERFVNSEGLMDEGVNRILLHDSAKMHFLRTRKENDLDVRIQLSQMLDGLTAIERGHEVIQEHEVGTIRVPREFFQRPHGIRGDLDRATGTLQHFFDKGGIDAVIIDDQNADIFLAGFTSRFAT